MGRRRRSCRTNASGPRNALNKRSQPGNAVARATQAALRAAASWLHSCEAPLSETVHDSSYRSIGVARGSRDGDDQRAWDGHRLGCRGRPPSHDTSHVVRAHGCSAMPTLPRAANGVCGLRRMFRRRPPLAKIKARRSHSTPINASILPANKSGSCSRT